MAEVREVACQQHGVMREADGGDFEVHGAGARVYAFQAVENSRGFGVKRQDVKMLKGGDCSLKTRVAGNLIPACLGAVNQSQPPTASCTVMIFRKTSAFF